MGAKVNRCSSEAVDDLGSQKGCSRHHYPERMEGLRAQQKSWRRKEVRAKTSPLVGSELVRERSGMVEGIEGTREKEGKGNLEHQPGHQLVIRVARKTLGRRERTNRLNAVYIKCGERRWLGNNYP